MAYNEIMKNFPASQTHSQYIARWRLYLWFCFLETGDDSIFIIPEDKKMAKKAKDKINRMEVMAYVESLFPAAGYADEHPTDKSSLYNITDVLFRKNDKTYKPNKPVKDMACYKELMNDVKSGMRVRSYSYVDDSDEIKVKSHENQASFSGADVLSLFNGKARIYEGKSVIARNDPSGYCCIYFENKNGKPLPIRGADAKIIGAAILADLATERLKQSTSEEVHLVQGYTWEGMKAGTAEYYSENARKNKKAQDKTLQEIRINSILSPLYILKADPSVLDFLKKKIQTLITLLIQELKLDPDLKNNRLKHAKTAQYYADALQKLLGESRDHILLDSIRIPKHLNRLQPSAIQFYRMIEPAIANPSSFKQKDKKTGKPYFHDNINHIKKTIADFNTLSAQKEISIFIMNDDLSENTDPKSIPTYFSLKTNNNSPYILQEEMDENQRFCFPLKNNGKPSHLLELAQSWHNIQMPNRPVPDGELARDMNEQAIYISRKGESIIHGSKRRGVSAEDVDLIAKKISRRLASELNNDSRINPETIRKLGYTCMYAHYFQAGMQTGYFPILGSVIFDNSSTTPGSKNKKFISMSVDDNGNACITLTSVSHINESFNNTYLDESLAIRTELRVNIFDKNPVFTMKQMAELKNVPELRPEYFFNEKPTPRPSLWGRYFGYTN